MADDAPIFPRKGGGAQARRPVTNRFTPAKRRVFLDHLAASANVSQSAQAAAISGPTAYHTRRRDPAFAAAWQAALTEAYHTLELKLLDTALNGQRHTTGSGEAEVVEVRQDTGLMMRLLAQHRQTAKVGPPVAPTPERAAILRERLHKDLERMAERLGVPVAEGTGPKDPPA